MTLYDVLAAPWRAWRDYRLERLRVHAEVQSAPFKALTDVVTKVMEAQEQQTKVFHEWLQMFKVTDVPTSTVVRDEDEAREELARQGILPNGMSPLEQLNWVHSVIDSDLEG